MCSLEHKPRRRAAMGIFNVFSGVSSFFKKVQCIMNNLDKIIGNGLKLGGILLADRLFANKVTIHFTTGLITCWMYLLVVTVKIVKFMYVVAFAGFCYLMGDVMLKKQSNFLREIMVMITTCRNDPRAWYVTPQHHNGNGYGRVPGDFGLCGCPCTESYVPFMGGVACRRAPATVPRHCPAAAVTRLYEGMGVKGPRGVLATPQNRELVDAYRAGCVAHIGAAGSSATGSDTDRAELVRTICSQARLFPNEVSAFCYEGMCATNRTSNRCSPASSLSAANSLAEGGGMMGTMLQIAIVTCLAYAVLYWTQARIHSDGGK